MTITFKELTERLKRLDEITLLEVLDLDSEVLVDRFQDIIEEKVEVLSQEFEDEEAFSSECYSEEAE